MTKFIAYAEGTTYTFTTNNSLDAEAEYTALRRIVVLHPEVTCIEVYNEFELAYTYYTNNATRYELICGGKIKGYYNYNEALEIKRNLLTFFDEKEIKLIKINLNK